MDEKNENSPPIRLQKYLADNGIASRRKSEEYILQGKVTVNGQIVNKLGTKVNPDIDTVEFENKIVKQNENDLIYILLNKPTGYVTTSSDEFGRDTVFDLVKVSQRVVPVGRLDMYTSGALILTNDGNFVYTVTHPKHEINKTYIVTVKEKVSPEKIKNLTDGVILDDEYKTKPAKVKIIEYDASKDITKIQITIHEGKNRQVRRMCDVVNIEVVELHRSSIGGFDVEKLPLGKWRYIDKEEIKKMI